MALQKINDVGGVNVNFYYVVHSCPLEWNSATIRVAYWWCRDDCVVRNLPPKGFLTFTARNRPARLDGNGNVLEAAITTFNTYFANDVLLQAGNSPRKNAYLYLKTLPEFATATDIDV